MKKDVTVFTRIRKRTKKYFFHYFLLTSDRPIYNIMFLILKNMLPFSEKPMLSKLTFRNLASVTILFTQRIFLNPKRISIQGIEFDAPFHDS